MNTTDTDFLNEDYVSFETADLMRMKGFPQKRDNSGYYATEMVYGITEQDDGTHHLCHQYPACYHFDDHICAPTLQIAIKWLRKKYNIFICVLFLEESNGYGYTIENIIEKKYIATSKNSSYNEPEDACEEAIKHCLTKII